MNRKNRIAIILLVIAIILAIISIMVRISIENITNEDSVKSSPETHAKASGTVQLIVQGSGGKSYGES